MNERNLVDSVIELTSRRFSVFVSAIQNQVLAQVCINVWMQ